MPANTVTAALRPGGALFSFEILNPGSTVGERVSFPAYITNISDSFSPDWGQYNDMGRGDPKVMYRSFSRTINLSFKIVALKRQGEDSTFDNYVNKINILSKAVYPHYVGGKGFVGRFIKFSIAKLWSNEYGYISSLSYNITNDTPWDTNIDGKGERPIVVEVDMSIQWIGDKRPNADTSKAYSEAPDEIVYIQNLDNIA